MFKRESGDHDIIRAGVGKHENPLTHVGRLQYRVRTLTYVGNAAFHVQSGPESINAVREEHGLPRTRLVDTALNRKRIVLDAIACRSARSFYVHASFRFGVRCTRGADLLSSKCRGS